MNRQYMSKQDLAYSLGVSVATVNRLMAAGMPYFRLGAGVTGAVRFDPERVHAWLTARESGDPVAVGA